MSMFKNYSTQAGCVGEAMGFVPPKGGREQGMFVVRNRKGGYFHFWDRRTYGEPQFGDARGAKHYANRAGAQARINALTKDGYEVRIERARNG